MKLTTQQLRQIIKEETKSLVKAGGQGTSPHKAARPRG